MISQTLLKSEFQFVKMLFSKVKKIKLFGIVFALVFGQAFYILLPALLGILIDEIFVKDRLHVTYLLFFPIVWSLSQIFAAISRFFTSAVTQDIRKISKEYVFKYLIDLSSNVYINKGAGEVESLMQEISFNSRYLFAESFPFFVRIFVSGITSILILSYSSFWFGLIFLGWLTLYVPISYIISKKAVKYVSKSLESSAEVSALTVDIIENHELIPAFGTVDFELGKFNHLLEKEWRAYIAAQLGIDKADLWQHFLQLLLPFSIVIFIIYAHDYISLSPGDIVALFTVTLIVAAQIKDFGRGILAFFEVKERMRTAISQLKSFEKFSSHAFMRGSKIPATYSINFEKAGFIYEENNMALQNVTLKIMENEKLGIIGYSGAGKSTLIKLLCGIYTPTSGSVYLGGISLKEIDPKFLVENISEVSQTIPIFHRSLRENLVYGCTQITDEKIWEIIERAQLTDCVNRLTNNLDTVIGVKGSKLSGGERARIAIARAFLKNSKIIIMDEATAALDSESESLLQKGLEELMTGRTVIAIAHRLSTLRSMDRIVMLEKGQITAVGSHETLFNTNELYKHLTNLQVLI